ncbi:MAG: YihY/virulence factor BrkB family protein [Candidatus Binatia bacterium]|nr:YihY/virulence factor BrkB family protein [Candidatus Binatia bacterium]
MESSSEVGGGSASRLDGADAKVEETGEPSPAGWRWAWEVLRETVKEFGEDRGLQLGAALAYYTVFAVAPLILVILSLTAFFLGADAAGGHLTEQFRGLVGEEGGGLIEQLIEQAAKGDTASWAGMIGLATAMFGASGVFAQLQAALNQIFDLKPNPTRSGVGRFLRARLVSLGIVVSVGFLLLVSLVASAAVAAIADQMRAVGTAGKIGAQAVSVSVSLAMATALFALIFRVLPDAEIRWREALAGGFATALLFALGKLLIGLYLGRSSLASVYGAAGSLAVLLVWVYYSAQIVLFGAELTQVTARKLGVPIQPSPWAQREGNKPT